MKYSTNVKPITYLKSHAAEIIKDVWQTREPYLITQNGEARLVVMDVPSYEEHMETFALLRIMAAGHLDIEAGNLTAADTSFFKTVTGPHK